MDMALQAGASFLCMWFGQLVSKDDQKLYNKESTRALVSGVWIGALRVSIGGNTVSVSGQMLTYRKAERR